MYNHNSLLIVSLLLVALLLAIEIGYRLGRHFGETTTDATKTQIGAIQASLLGVLALLLGFTFSLALQRFDSRSAAVVDEANAIGTALLRSDVLPDSTRQRAHTQLNEYIDLRIEGGTISLDRLAEREQMLASTLAQQASVWAVATEAARDVSGAPNARFFAQALNDMIDAYSKRIAALNRHVPEIVLFLLFGTFALTACLVGYSSGVSGHRATFPTYILVLLITFLVFIIIDLDRPRRGLIEVSQQSMLDLRADQAP